MAAPNFARVNASLRDALRKARLERRKHRLDLKWHTIARLESCVASRARAPQVPQPPRAPGSAAKVAGPFFARACSAGMPIARRRFREIFPHGFARKRSLGHSSPRSGQDSQEEDGCALLRARRCANAASRRQGPARERTTKGRYSIRCLVPPPSGVFRKSTMKAKAR